MQVIRAARFVRHGGVIAYPTEAVFGLGCAPFLAEAIDRVYALKGRDTSKPCLLIGADPDALLPFIDPQARASHGRHYREKLAQAGTTWVFPARAGLPPWLVPSSGRIAMRVPDHAVARHLAKLTGPIISTSANRSAKAPLRSADAVRSCWRREPPDYVLDAPVGGYPGPTTIRDADTDRVLRT